MIGSGLSSKCGETGGRRDLVVGIAVGNGDLVFWPLAVNADDPEAAGLDVRDLANGDAAAETRAADRRRRGAQALGDQV